MAWLPPWIAGYRRSWLAGDLTAGLIVTVMLIPQSLAYAMLAGLPPQMGLYASMLPLAAYSLLGSSKTLAVGPVAVISLMTASALQPLASAGSPQYIALAMQLALLSGMILLAFGVLRLGVLANFLSEPVISGFISGSAILIALSQATHLLGVTVPTDGTLEMVSGLIGALPRLNPVTAALGVSTIVFLLITRAWLARLLAYFVRPPLAGLLARLAPMAAIILATAVTAALDLHDTAAVTIVGSVPAGLPGLALPMPGWSAVSQLWFPALLIALVGFVESVSVARSLGSRRGQHVAPDRELLGLGAANIASALSGGFAVTGGFARSVVNFDAGANTPLAGVVSALLIAGVMAGLTGLFFNLPHTVLAATIIVAVLSLFDWHAMKRTWRYDRADGLALLATMAGVVLLGVEQGIIAGIAVSLAMLVWRSSRPHIAVVGRVPGTEHFRNVKRHAVETVEGVLSVRIDESLFFGNASVVRESLEDHIAAQPHTKRLVLILSGVNHIDATALGTLAELERHLELRGIELWLAELKGPVMDRLAATDFGQKMKDRISLSAHDAVVAGLR